MRLILVAVFVAVGVDYVRGTLDLACPPALYPVPPLQCGTCFNVKQTIFQKNPLLYKLKAKLCKLCCDPIKEANPCPIGPPISPLLLAPPPPTVIPLPPVAPTINPQLLSLLLSLKAPAATVPACPTLPLQPALDTCTCV